MFPFIKSDLLYISPFLQVNLNSPLLFWFQFLTLLCCTGLESPGHVISNSSCTIALNHMPPYFAPLLGQAMQAVWWWVWKWEGPAGLLHSHWLPSSQQPPWSHPRSGEQARIGTVFVCSSQVCQLIIIVLYLSTLTIELVLLKTVTLFIHFAIHSFLVPSEDLDSEARVEKWDKVRIICLQPFRKDGQFGLSLFRLHTSVEVTWPNFA